MKSLLKLPLKIFRLPKKILIPLLLIILVGGYFFISSTSKKQPQYQTSSVERKDLKVEVSSSGILTGTENSALKFKSSGKLAYLNVKIGDTVTKGEVLAGLDTQDLNITLQQAYNTYRDKQAIAAKAEDDVKDHASDETFAQRQTRTTAQVARDNAYDSVKAAQRAFQDAVIVSPINGLVVAQADLIPGQNVSGSDLIAQVADFSQVVFTADVDETDIGKISIGQKAEISLNTYPDKAFQGSVIQIQPQTKTSSSGATTVAVKVSLDDQSVQHIYGLNGQANIIQQEAKNVLSIPLSSLISDRFVLVKKSNNYQREEVTTGLKTDSDVEITSGLKEGDEVVVNPPSNLNITQRRTILNLFGPTRVGTGTRR